MIHRMKTRIATVASAEKSDRSFGDIILYALAWVAPLLLVVIGVGMSAGAENFMDYGSDGLCWMSWKHRGIFYLFVAPSGLALLINIALVVATALSLIQLRSTQSSLPRSRVLTVESIFGVVARISVSMGLEWMLGFVLYYLPGYLALQYGFVLVVGLHGLWLLIATLTLGTWKTLRERMKTFLCSVFTTESNRG